MMGEWISFGVFLSSFFTMGYRLGNGPKFWKLWK